MIKFGYKRGVPPHVSTAWGCRALVEQNGMVDVLWDRTDVVGPDQVQLAAHLKDHVGAAWCDRASELLHTQAMRIDRDEEFVLYEDHTVMIKGNTQSSHGYLYVCAYLRPRCQALICRGDIGVDSCDQPLDEDGDCPRVGYHIE